MTKEKAEAVTEKILALMDELIDYYATEEHTNYKPVDKAKEDLICTLMGNIE